VPGGVASVAIPQEASNSNGFRPAGGVAGGVATPDSGAHSTPSQTTAPADQDELIRNLVALVKADPGVCPFTLAMKLDPHHRLGLGSDEVIALLKTDAVR